MSKPNLEGKIPLEQVLIKFNVKNKEFINSIEKEESLDKIETIDSVINQIKSDKISTNLKKQQFINEIKSDLGKEVKKNPGKIRKIEKKWYQKLGLVIKKMFTKF